MEECPPCLGGSGPVGHIKAHLPPSACYIQDRVAMVTGLYIYIIRVMYRDYFLSIGIRCGLRLPYLGPLLVFVKDDEV